MSQATIAKLDSELVQRIATAGTREPPAIMLSLHHLTHAEATEGCEPRVTNFLLPPYLAEQLASELMDSVRASATRSRFRDEQGSLAFVARQQDWTADKSPSASAWPADIREFQIAAARARERFSDVRRLVVHHRRLSAD